jgi:hypothetical protein
MRTEFAPSYPVSIFIAGGLRAAKETCREHCDEVGLCVTVRSTAYIYTGGEEPGVVVGLINYPRFPAEPAQIEAKAIELGVKLRKALGQESFAVQTPTTTTWFSWRAEDLASCDTHPKGGDVKQAPFMSGAVPEGQTPAQGIPIEDRKP